MHENLVYKISFDGVLPCHFISSFDGGLPSEGVYAFARQMAIFFLYWIPVVEGTVIIVSVAGIELKFSFEGELL